MLTETCRVSRKTPRDGKLEITPATAEILASFRTPLLLSIGAERQDARLEAMPCTCAKGEGRGHVHHFLECSWFRTLREGDEVRLVIDEVERTIAATTVAGAEG